MAKPNIPNQKSKYNALNKRLANYVALVRQIYDVLNLEAAKMAESVKYNDEGKEFHFKDYPELTERVKKLQNTFVSDISSVIYRGTSEEWKNSNLVQDLVADKVLNTYGAKVNGKKYNVYYQTNSDALKAFQERKDRGLNLSQKIWNQSINYKTELEYAISSAIQKGTSAVTLSKRISKYLQDFKSLQKDYKEKYGKAVDCHDCEYRSIRLARSEINLAYRTAEQKRWEQMDFVVGQEIKLSNNHTCNGLPFTDICDDLKGKYPKDFKFTGWHPMCRCYVIPILKTEDEFWSDNNTKSKNVVNDVPKQFKGWILNNKARIEKSRTRGTLPYFINDNQRYAVLRQTPQEIAKIRHAYRDEESIRRAARNRYLLDVANVDNRMIAGLRRNAKLYGVDISEFEDYIYNHKFKESFDMIARAEEAPLESLYEKYKGMILAKSREFDKRKDYLANIVSNNPSYGEFASKSKERIEKITISKSRSYSNAIEELEELKKELVEQYRTFETKPLTINANYKEFKEINFKTLPTDLDRYQEGMSMLSMLYGPKYASTYVYKLVDNELNRSKDFKKAFGVFKKAYDDDIVDLMKSINKLTEIKNSDLSQIYKPWISKFNDYISNINDFDITTKGYRGIYQDIEGAYNILKLSTNRKCIKYGLDKLSINTPNILIEEYSKIFNDPFALIADKKFYDGFERFVPTNVRYKKGSYFSPEYEHVRIAITDRTKDSRYYALKIQYHEYGHVMDKLQGDWRKQEEWIKLFDKYKDIFNNDKDRYYDGSVQYGAKLKERYWDVFINTKQTNDDREMAGSLSDIFMSFDKNKEKFGHGGHTKVYFKDKDKCLAEFIAHASECYWEGNGIFANVYRELYDDLIMLYKKYFNKYKAK